MRISITYVPKLLVEWIKQKGGIVSLHDVLSDFQFCRVGESTIHGSLELGNSPTILNKMTEVEKSSMRAISARLLMELVLDGLVFRSGWIVHNKVACQGHKLVEQAHILSEVMHPRMLALSPVLIGDATTKLIIAACNDLFAEIADTERLKKLSQDEFASMRASCRSIAGAFRDCTPEQIEKLAQEAKCSVDELRRRFRKIKETGFSDYD